METITHNIVRHIAVLSTGKNEWTKELNLVSWNNRPAVYDIRNWSPDHERTGKGITLTQREMNIIYNVMEEVKNGKQD